MNKRIFVLVSMVGFGASLLISQTTNPTQTQMGTVRGIVVAEGTSDPLADVQVTVGGGIALAQLQGATAGLQAALESFAGLVNAAAIETAVQRALETQGGRGGVNAGSVYTATSGSDGRFVINGIPPGQYAVAAQREGYFGQAIGGISQPLARENVTVVSQQVADVQIVLIPGAAIGGRVLGPNGSPAIGASSEVARVIYQNGMPALQTVSTRQTDDRGEYRLFRLPPGDYLVSTTPRAQIAIGARGNAPSSSDAIQVRTFYPGTTDAREALPVTLRGGEDVAGMNIQVRTVVGFTVSGRVISSLPVVAPQPDAGGPRGAAARANAATVTLVPHDKNALADPIAAVSSAITVSMASPNDGSFRIPNIPAGSYDLFASLPDPGGYGPGAPPGQAIQGVSYGRTFVDVRGNIDGVNVNVHPGMDVKGRVIVDGRPINANVRITLQPDDAAARMQVYQQVGRFQPVIGQDGSFSIPLVPEGVFRVQATIAGFVAGARGGRGQAGAGAQLAGATVAATTFPGALPPGAYIADVRQGGAAIHDDGLHVAAQEVIPVDVIINSNGGSLQGTVLTTNMRPVTGGTTVVLAPALERRQNPTLYRLAMTNADGNVLMNGLPPGQYKLFAFASIPAGAYQNAEFIRRYEDRGVSVSIAAGANVSQQLSVIPAESARR